MEFTAFAGEIKSAHALAPVYLFCGPEAYLRDRGIELLKGAAEDLAGNAVRIVSAEADWARVTSELYTPSFLGGRKLVVLADDGNFIHNHLRELKTYVQSPSPTAILAAVIPSEKAMGLAEGPALRIVECKTPRPADRVRWVQSEFQRRGKSADRAVAEAFCRCGGEDLAGLAGHVENIALFVGGRARVTVEDVERMVGGGLQERQTYELALATAKKQPRQAMEIAHALLEAGEAPQKILWKLAWEYRKLVEAKKLIQSGRRRFEVTSLLQITFFPDEFLGFVDRHSLEELLDKHGEILAADIALKSSVASEEAIMASLVLRLAA